jgi:riboflavin kinase/FMN adenylyltransferase
MFSETFTSARLTGRRLVTALIGVLRRAFIAELPGEPIAGTVIRGDQRGRELGFPTANVRLPMGRKGPKFGVYAGFLDGRPAAVSIGVRPTFGRGLEPLLEAYVLDFCGDLYGHTVEVRLVRFIRGEKKFDSVGELVSQIHRDVDHVRQITNVEAARDDARRTPRRPGARRRRRLW